MNTAKVRIASLFILAVLSAPIAAERYYSYGAYTIHYNAVRTDILSRDSARAYGVVRSTNRAFVNISVHKDEDGTAVKALVEANATNLNGQLRGLQMREISSSQEGSVYYIAEMPISNEEIIDYSVKVVPSGETDAITFEFQQQFFTD